ncbi:DeoR/GlpR family DNA-binding transcription regulator [Vibrio hibernica]|uniref:DeoR/GlpR family DNA-binding transcription regulator n=2 Tax=Vibrio hibernica TaxID=2587465 RepID=UPI001880FA38|nr:DeoR/GlpR family DNA-binding transcription regulator [Vibrio hibernica]
MDVKLTERQHQIVSLLKQQNYCSIEKLSRQFSITTQTVRRDIKELCDLGVARRHHGGVGLPVSLENSSFLNRQVSYAEAKQKLASRVVNDIPNGATIFLGIGTTMSVIAEHLKHHKELRIITNNFEAAAILSQHKHLETWITGGRLRTNDRDILGQCSNEFFNQFSADIGILSCAGIGSLKAPQSLSSSPPENLTQGWCLEHEPQEAHASRAIINNSKQTWLVAHAQKWNIVANTKVEMLQNFDRVFKE